MSHVEEKWESKRIWNSVCHFSLQSSMEKHSILDTDILVHILILQSEKIKQKITKNQSNTDLTNLSIYPLFPHEYICPLQGIVTSGLNHESCIRRLLKKMAFL